MTDKEILEKATQKAKNNGWKYNAEYVDNRLNGMPVGFNIIDEPNQLWPRFVPVIQLIFDHDFAKALWGVEPRQVSYDYIPDAWQYHLQEMVIAEDPVKYLGEHLD